MPLRAPDRDLLPLGKRQITPRQRFRRRRELGWWHAARPPEPPSPHGRRPPGPNRGVLTRASRRDGSPELTVILTPRNRGPARRRQGASPGPIRTPLPNSHRNLLSQGVATTT